MTSNAHAYAGETCRERKTFRTAHRTHRAAPRTNRMLACVSNMDSIRIQGEHGFNVFRKHSFEALIDLLIRNAS